MNAPGFYTNRGWESSRGRYELVQSPKGTLILSPSTIPFLVLLFSAGLFLGRMWINVGTLPALDGYSTNNNASLPIAWLMSFPNSGTTYTGYLVRETTGTNTGTNYGKEYVGGDGTSVAVFKDSPGGPFYADPLKYKRPTKGYLLTKTHCGSRCNQCSPEKSVENINIFMNRCFEGSYITKDANDEPRIVTGYYSQNLLAKAVHLIRDPFDNVVSRFHYSRMHFGMRNQTDKLAMYPRSREGFRAFCKDLGSRFHEKERDSKFYTDVFDEIKDIPCHADFFRWIQWHNLAFTTTWDLNIPTMILHYENYTSNFDETKDMLLEFLDQDGVNEPPLFETGKTYREYYTNGEIKSVESMFRKLALNKTWYHTKHYFD